MEFWFENGNEKQALKCYSHLKLLFRKSKEASTVNALLKLLYRYGKKNRSLDRVGKGFG